MMKLVVRMGISGHEKWVTRHRKMLTVDEGETKKITDEEVVDQHHKQKQKEVSAWTKATLTVGGLFGSTYNEASRLTEKRRGTAEMLKDRRLEERRMDGWEVLGSIGHRTGVGKKTKDS